MIVDAHLDLAYSALEHERNLFLPVNDLRQIETRRPVRDGIATVTFPELRKGGVGLIFATLFVEPERKKSYSQRMLYRNADQAYRLALQQLDYYHRIVDENQSLRLVTNAKILQEVIDGQEGDRPLLGIVPLMEGADPVRDPAELEEWYERGVRLIGPAWHNTRYAAGGWDNSDEGFTKDGFHLMEVMADIGFILDLTHLSEKAAKQALERYEGQVVATHSNCRVLAPQFEQRHLSDAHIRLLGERNGMMGIALFNPFLKRQHSKGERRELVTLDHVVAHIDHICQLLGSADYVGIGSDFDGGFGQADIPSEMESVADLRLIGDKLKDRGYEPADIAKIMGENWIDVLGRSWA